MEKIKQPDKVNIINIDVSEVKAFRECERKWAFSSRNKLHLRAKEQKLPLRMGTVFHKAIERMYLGVDLKLKDLTDEHEIEDKDAKMLELNLGGYYKNVLKQDLENFAVVDTEHRFNIPILSICPDMYFVDIFNNSINLTGSIDLVYRYRGTDTHGALEHKYIKNFRPDTYEQLDEQPKMYFYAIQHDFGNCKVIGLNQIRKLKTKFDHARTHMIYTPEQIDNFLKNFVNSCIDISYAMQQQYFPCTPSYMGCQLCDYAPLCLDMNSLGTDDINIIDDEYLLSEFGFEKRIIDHLDEK